MTQERAKHFDTANQTIYMGTVFNALGLYPISLEGLPSINEDNTLIEFPRGFLEFRENSVSLHGREAEVFVFGTTRQNSKAPYYLVVDPEMWMPVYDEGKVTSSGEVRERRTTRKQGFQC